MSDSYLLRLLPRAWRNDPLARELANAVGAPLDQARSTIDTLSRYVDPEAAPDEALDWLMQLVALPRRDGLTARKKRNLIHTAWRTWSQKGRRDAIERWVRALTDITSEVRNLNTHAFVAGISKAGDVCGPGVLAWRWEIAIPAGSIDPATLRTILAPVVPDIGSYRIVDLYGAVLDDFPT